MTFTDTALLFISAYIMGFVAAVPVGATQLEIIRRSIEGRVVSGILMTAGATSADLVYGAVVFFGVLRVLRIPKVNIAFWIVNTLVLVGLGWWSIRSGRQMRHKNKLEGGKKSLSTKGSVMEKKGVALLTGFTLGITNPLMMTWWLVGAHLLVTLGTMPSDYSIHAVLIFLAATALGLLSYSTLLALVVHRFHRSFAPTTVSRISIVFGIVLLCLAGYFAVRTVGQLIQIL